MSSAVSVNSGGEVAGGHYLSILPLDGGVALGREEAKSKAN